MNLRFRTTLPLALATLALAAVPATASSHREAPGITKSPKVDATDFYLFRSYEPGRDGYVTMIANYLPLQDPYGGPNYFSLDPDAIYELKVDNDGDAVEDLTFRFRFRNERRDVALSIGNVDDKRSVAVPLVQVGQIGAGSTDALNVVEKYGVELVRGARRTGDLLPAQPLRDVATGSLDFTKPVDNIGAKTIPAYDDYARRYVYDVAIPGCGDGRLFVGQRKDPFVVNLGEIFDLVNLANPLGPVDGEGDDLDDKNVTSLILEVPAACLTTAGNPVVGAWTTASVRRNAFPNSSEEKSSIRGAQRSAPSPASHVQVSRLSSPLVNEIVIGLKDKDRFNASQPRDDAQFLTYVTHPTFPALVEVLFGAAGVKAPTLFPRADLVAAFLTGIDGLNATATPAEMLRLNTAVPARPAGQQSHLGALGGDIAGFPNGRRPGDDVVDIELRVAMGALLDPSVAPSGSLPFTDGAKVDDSFFDAAFPYLRTPIAGSPRP